MLRSASSREREKFISLHCPFIPWPQVAFAYMRVTVKSSTYFEASSKRQKRTNPKSNIVRYLSQFGRALTSRDRFLEWGARSPLFTISIRSLHRSIGPAYSIINPINIGKSGKLCTALNSKNMCRTANTFRIALKTRQAIFIPPTCR